MKATQETKTCDSFTNASQSPTKNERYSKVFQDDDLDVIDEESMLKFQKALSMPISITQTNNAGVETKLIDLKIDEIDEDLKSSDDSKSSVSESDNFFKKQDEYKSNKNVSEKKCVKKLNKKHFFIHKASSFKKPHQNRSVSPDKGVISNIKSSSRKLQFMKLKSVAFQSKQDSKISQQNSNKQSTSSFDEFEISPMSANQGSEFVRSIISPIRCEGGDLRGELHLLNSLFYSVN